MHSPSGLEAFLRNSEGSCHTSAIEQNLCHLLHLVSCRSFSTQLYSPCTLNWVYAPAAYPKCRCQNTTAISHTMGADALAVIPGYLSSIKLTLVCCHCQSIKLYKNLTYTPHVTRGYRIKLQCQEYTEQGTTEHTSVGLALAHACPT